MATQPVVPQPSGIFPVPGLVSSQPEETKDLEVDLLADNDELQTVVKNLAKHFIGLDKWVRRQEVIDARRQRFYWRGDQYIYWKSDAIGFVPAIGGASAALGDSQTEIP